MRILAGVSVSIVCFYVAITVVARLAESVVWLRPAVVQTAALVAIAAGLVTMKVVARAVAAAGTNTGGEAESSGGRRPGSK